MGRERDTRQTADANLAPPVAIDSMRSPRNQWDVMLERLLATG